MKLTNLTQEEKIARKKKQKAEAQKRYYQKNKEYYKKYSKEHLYNKNMIKITYDLKNIVISALRYALGRKTYITQETSEFIMSNSDLIDERVCIVMLRDLSRYFEDRKLWEYKDDECDYQSWLALQNWLFKIAKEKEFNIVGYERR